MSDVQVIGHRVVHGGSLFHKPVLIEAKVSAAIESLSEVAPLHNRLVLASIRTAKKMIPSVSQIAVFDTAFFSDLPAAAHVYPLPYKWYKEWGIRRYGFHGISYTYCASQAALMLNRPLGQLRLVICHLGSGCSASAVRDGRAVATTMGFTPLEGLTMGSRSGSIDPGILLYLLNQEKTSLREMEKALLYESGLLGLSGVSSDFRQIQIAASNGHERARLAIEIFVDRVRGAIASLAASMGGLDALIFTAGIGESAAEVRQSVCEGLSWIGCRLDQDKNKHSEPDSDLS